MYTSFSDAVVLSTTIRDSVENISGLEIILCPPAVWLTEIAHIINKNIHHLSLGAQNIHYMSEGEFTGEISALMIRDIAKYVIIGHSERRKHFDEDLPIISRKVAAAIDASLSPIVCVGERKQSQGSASEVVKELEEELSDINKEDYKNLIIAYEPIWAIGSEEPATPEYAAKIITALREVVHFETPILYGGSIDATNVYKFVSRPEIDGVLVGRSGLKAKEFIKICRIVAEYKRII
jgi:triosephosphate isomerase